MNASSEPAPVQLNDALKYAKKSLPANLTGFL